MAKTKRKPRKEKPDRCWLLVRAAGTTASLDSFLALLKFEDDKDLEEACYVLELLHGLAQYELEQRGKPAPNVLPKRRLAGNVVELRPRA